MLLIDAVGLAVQVEKSTEAGNAALRHQLIVLQRRLRGRVHLTNSDRLFFIQLYRWFPSVLKAMTIIRPETLVRWHCAGFRRYWRYRFDLNVSTTWCWKTAGATLGQHSAKFAKSRCAPGALIPTRWPAD